MLFGLTVKTSAIGPVNPRLPKARHRAAKPARAALPAVLRASRPALRTYGSSLVRCACHTTKEGDNRLGPNLHNIIGRKAGSLQNYGYSSAGSVSWRLSPMYVLISLAIRSGRSRAFQWLFRRSPK